MEGKRIYWYNNDGFFWIRVYGYGFYLKDTRKHGASFSERNGYEGIKIRHWYFGILERNNQGKKINILCKVFGHWWSNKKENHSFKWMKAVDHHCKICGKLLRTDKHWPE